MKLRLSLRIGTCTAVLSLVVSLTVTNTSAAADADDAAPVKLPALEVVEQPLASLPEVNAYAAATTTIDAAQLRDMQALDFASALRRTPGVTITRYNQIGAFGGGEGGAVFLRGLGSSRPGGEIKTLVDGVPKMNGIFNHPLLDLMSVDLADHIDVHTRANPLEFGNTFAAVNVVTPRVTQPGQIARGNLAVGSFSTIVERLDAGAKTGAFDYYVTQSLRRSDGARDDSDGRLENCFLRLGRELSPQWDLTYEVNHTHNRTTDPGEEGATTASTRGETYTTDDWLHIAVLSHRYTRGEGSLRVYCNDGEGNWLRRNFSGNSDSLNDWRLYGVRWRETLHLWEQGEILAGIDLDYDRGTSISVPVEPAEPTIFGPATARILSAYAGANHTFNAGALTVTPSVGARFYQHNALGSKWAPQAGLVATSGSTQWHAAWSRAVNFPGLEVRALSQFISALGTSWEGLNPEEADEFEVGLRHEFGANASLSATLFRNNVRNRYVIVFPPPPPPRYVNLGSYHTEGGELMAEFAPAESIKIFLGAAFLRTDPGDLPYAPQSTFTSGCNWQFSPAWFLSTDCSYVSAMHVYSAGRSASASNPTEVGAQFLLNARLARRFSWGAEGKHRGEVYISGENLTDRSITYTPGYPLPGINGMLGIRFEL